MRSPPSERLRDRLVEVLDVDEALRLRDVVLHQREQVHPAGHRQELAALGAERRDGFFLVRRVDVSKGLHSVPPARSCWSAASTVSGVNGQFADPHAGGVRHRVGDRRGGRNDRRLAEADHAALRLIDQRDVDDRDVGDTRQQVPLHVRVHHLRGVAIEDPVLEQREAEPHDDAAVASGCRRSSCRRSSRSPARETIFLTRVMPVSMSTSTSANCTPLVPTPESPRPLAGRLDRRLAEQLARVLPRHALCTACP